MRSACMAQISQTAVIFLALRQQCSAARCYRERLLCGRGGPAAPRPSQDGGVCCGPLLGASVASDRQRVRSRSAQGWGQALEGRHPQRQPARRLVHKGGDGSRGGMPRQWQWQRRWRRYQTNDCLAGVISLRQDH